MTAPETPGTPTPGQAERAALEAKIHDRVNRNCSFGVGPCPVCDNLTAEFMVLADAYAKAAAPATPQSAPVALTPAISRPALGSTIILAVGEAPDDIVRELRDRLAVLHEGMTVVTVRGVEALRTWEPPAAPAFRHRFTIIPDTGDTELHCSHHMPWAEKWLVGYRPSLDVLIEQARAHNLAEHGGDQ